MRIIDETGLTTRRYRAADIHDTQPYLRHHRPRYALFCGVTATFEAGALRYRSVFFRAGEYMPMSLMSRVD